MKQHTIQTALALALLASSTVHAQDAVQWNVSDGGNGHWYGLRQRGTRSWTHLEAACRAEGGHLATMNGPTERDFLVSVMVGNTCAIGGVQTVTGPQDEPAQGWGWVTGEPMAWTNWAGWEPGNTDSYGAAEENVMGCFANGIWVDLADHLLWTQHYLIEWEADCNNDGIVDFGQIRNGELADIDGNNIPDCCESGSSCAPNIIVNGGFEVGASQADCTWVIHAAAGSFVPGWSVVAASIDRVRITGSCPPGTESWTSFEGEFTIDLDGDTSGGAISQTVSTEPDSMYRLTFQLTGNCAPGVKPMRVEIGSVQYPFEHVCAGTNPQRWREVSVEFTASASTTSIGFRSLSTGGNNGAVIDAVRLVRVGPQQPTCVDADLYRDFNVNGADLGIMLSQWGPNTPLTESDLNNDGVVNGADLGLLLAFWGACP